MAKLEGIIYKVFDQYVVLRGFAPIGELARVSKRPESYQRVADNNHKIEIVELLDKGEFKYFPEIILGCRAEKYAEFLSNIGIDDAVDRDDAQFVPGLKVLSERIPYDGYRARHAHLHCKDQGLVRIDGNHRLEPFDEDDSWWQNYFNTNS